MKVVYDAQIFAEQEFGGISRYYCALATQISQLPGSEARIVAPLYINKYVKELDREIVAGCYVQRVPKTGRVIKALSSTFFNTVAGWVKPDIVHETYYAEHPTYRGRVPHVLTVYDMIHERCAESFAANDAVARLKEYAVRRADHIFCISENTRRDLLDIHRIPADRVTVTYLGYDTLPLNGPLAEDLVGPSPYLLYVGGRHGYKNFEGLMHAFASSAWLKSNFRIVCFGGGVFTDKERQAVADLDLSATHVTHIGGGDDRLAALYKAAAAFVYPSKYEGFGIPPLEAMSLRCPVICSSTSSVPEVVGEAGEYFEPLDTESIRVSIERVLESPGRRDELVTLGQSRCKQFSWERCAQETMGVYRRLIA